MTLISELTSLKNLLLLLAIAIVLFVKDFWWFALTLTGFSLIMQISFNPPVSIPPEEKKKKEEHEFEQEVTGEMVEPEESMGEPEGDDAGDADDGDDGDD